MAEQPLNQPAEIPPELDRWNWGAFFLNWIWGIGNSTFIALLSLIPFVGFVMLFVLGARGSRWAWRNRAWRDAEHFRSTQRKWAIAGLAIWLAMIALFAGLFASIPYILKSSEAYQMTMSAVRADQRVAEALGGNLTDGFWVSGSVSVDANGTGEATLGIPIQGAKGAGTAHSHAVRSGGIWSMRLLFVMVDGSDTPIVLVNEDDVDVPGAALDL